MTRRDIRAPRESIVRAGRPCPLRKMMTQANRDAEAMRRRSAEDAALPAPVVINKGRGA